MKKTLIEFREFISKGNVLDLAVAVIIGAAFGKIVTSFVNDVLMPPIGLLLGGLDMKDFAFVLQEAAGETPAVVLKYGMFLQNVFDFLIIALCIFMIVKMIAKLKKKEEEKPAEPAALSKDQELLSEIRDLLKERK